MNQTANYQLNQWDAADPIRREDFNADNAAIDAALAAVKSESAEDLQTLAESVTAALGSGGSTCRIVYGSYTGTGTYGKDSPCTLTFDFRPLLVILSKTSSTYPAAIFLRGMASAPCLSNSYTVTISWGNNWVSWYHANLVDYQANASGTPYYYMAIGDNPA